MDQSQSVEVLQSQLQFQTIEFFESISWIHIML